MQPIRRLAIVNRGEAALRCIRTVKSLRAVEGSGLRVVALYTAGDREAPYVRHADFAARLPVRTTPVAAYLDHDLLLETLQDIGADAVWPGWGFVSESPEFVEKLASAGIRFLGPTAETMRSLGDKIASKQLAERVGVPVTEWSGGVVADAAAAEACLATIGFPAVIKASAGGGGRGIRIVRALKDVQEAFRSAASEAKTAFGDDRLLIERMVQGGRHIEVQIVADQHGFVSGVGCRDCSVQRRHQKVIEEAPPHHVGETLQHAMKQAAERLAREVSYCGVGTVEFLVEGERFYFLEMNPRLQVEHGITEEVAGLDLVEAQIRIARGENLAGLQLSEDGVCIEARVCAEDPDAGFLPSPGRIARFDPALGPRVRVDSGVVAGSDVPAAFDSLIAKVMASGKTRDEARSRLLGALRDFDLVIEGGATNKSYLLELLDSDEYRAGGVDTLWLDRWTAQERVRPYAPEALVMASVLAYRSSWQATRHNFFADTSNITPEKVPALEGRELDLDYMGTPHRVRVFSVGSRRYRVHLDGRVVSTRVSDAGDHTARMVISGRYLRTAYDITDAHIRVELEGCVHVFGRQTAGQVRAGAPSMVVSVDVQAGDRVAAGQPLGLLEAMKMEIAFKAPVSGQVTEVRVSKGQQVAAGELLLVIDPGAEASKAGQEQARLVLPIEDEPLGVLFGRDASGSLTQPDLVTAPSADPARLEAAIGAVHEEVDRIVLGFDVFPARFEKILEFLEAPLPEGLSEDFRSRLAAISRQLTVFADVEQLFSRARRVAEAGTLDPSNNARFRVYLRRIRTQGAGIAEDFLQLLRRALAHYGVHDLEYGDDLERAVLRMFASQRDPSHRHRLVMAVLRRVIALLTSGVDLSADHDLRNALIRIADMRGELSNALADTAIEAYYRGFRAPELARHLEQTTRRLESWLEVAESGEPAPSPPSEVLDDLCFAAESQFARVREWLRGDDRWRRMIALSAFVRRLYAPTVPESHRSESVDGRWISRSRYDGELVLATVCNVDEVRSAMAALRSAVAGDTPTRALELIVVAETDHSPVAHREAVEAALGSGPDAVRVTVTALTPDGIANHDTLSIGSDGQQTWEELHGLHPEAARRVNLRRYRNFELERMWASPGFYCFHARSRDEAQDERVFVLADVRTRPAVEGHDAALFVPIIESAFQEATRTMRLNLGICDPRRRLHWNRIVMHLAHPMSVDGPTAQQIARNLLSSIRYLGLEKTIVQLPVLNAERPDEPPRAVEVVFADLASSRFSMEWRRPRRRPLVPATPYERNVAEARRRGLVYPYEIIRMLTQGDESSERSVEETAGQGSRPVLPVGSFEEYDLAPGSEKPVAVSVAGRTPGLNTAAIIFGVIDTPTDKIPEGMKRVAIFSDPTMGMGSLAVPECDRVLAAIDLADKLDVPVEWIPVSAGARIAMDSGTENLDATARVVRRIITFTQSGGVIHLIVTGVNVGAQSYWDALATMLMHTRGVLIMTPQASMVLTGSAALAASGSVSAEDEVTIGGHERVMGPNGQAQYFATDLLDAYRLLYEHYDFTYVPPGETGPRPRSSADPDDRDPCASPYVGDRPASETDFATVGEIFDDTANPGRKRPFYMRALMASVIDSDGGHLERWSSHVGAETAIVWDAHLGGHPVCVLGIESTNVPRTGYRPLDGPESWNGGTLFPQSSKKVARALNAASGNRPVVVLANLSGFDGSPESMRKLQLEYGAEIARAVVNFRGPILFAVVARYHGGAYVVFSRELNPSLKAVALQGSYASVIGGGPAATVVFPREVRARVAADPRVQAMRAHLRGEPSAEERAAFDRVRKDVTLEKRAEVATEFDEIHTVERARRVGSLEAIIAARELRAHLIEAIRAYREPRSAASTLRQAT